MATINEMKDAVTELINSDGLVEIPNLNFDVIVENIVNVKYKKSLDLVTSKEDKSKLKEDLIKYYTEESREEIEHNINIIKSNFSAAKDGLSYAMEAATTSIMSNSIPSVITTGAAASIPNPAYVLIENKQKKNTLLAILKNIGNFLANLLSASIKILFEVPDTVITMINTLTNIKKVVNAIPV